MKANVKSGASADEETSGNKRTNTGNTNGPIKAPLIKQLPKPAAVDFCAITPLSSPNQLQSLSKFCRMP